MKITAQLAAAALAVALTSAHAEFTYTLTDLNPDDGIAPAFSGGNVNGDDREHVLVKTDTGVAYEANMTEEFVWEITPYTRIDFTVTAVSSGGGPFSYYPGGPTLHSSNSREVISFNDLQEGGSHLYQYVYINSPVHWSEPTFRTLSNIFNGSFFTSAAGGSASRQAYTDTVNFYPNSPPVPEPETYALLLVGLAGVGVMARRGRLARRGAVIEI